MFLLYFLEAQALLTKFVFALSETGSLEGAGAGRNFLIPAGVRNSPWQNPFPWRVSLCYEEDPEQYFIMPTHLPRCRKLEEILVSSP